MAFVVPSGHFVGRRIGQSGECSVETHGANVSAGNVLIEQLHFIIVSYPSIVPTEQRNGILFLSHCFKTL